MSRLLLPEMIKKCSKPLAAAFIFLTLPLHSLYAATEQAACDLENRYLSYKGVNQTVEEILKEIGRQSGLTLKYNNFNSLNTKTSIILNNVSVVSSINRLLRTENYSLTCDGNKGSISLNVLGPKSSRPLVDDDRSSGENHSAARTAQDASLQSLEDAFHGYDPQKASFFAKGSHARDDSDPLQPMEDAFAEYEKMKPGSLAEPAPGRDDSDPLQALEDTYAEYEKMKPESFAKPAPGRDDSDPLQALEDAYAEYEKMKPESFAKPAPGRDDSDPLQALEDAFNDYLKKGS